MRLLYICFGLLLLSNFCLAQSDTIRTRSGLRYTILEDGGGRKVSKGSKVKVHYTGRLTNGTIFDTSEGKKPLSIKAGNGEVIPGWDEMLLLMQEGEAVEVYIPSHLAYHKRGVTNPEAPGTYVIPPNADLIFRMKVMDVKK